MGYTTDFYGSFEITPPLKKEHREYLEAFAGTRRMKRDPALLPPDPVREAVGLPPGHKGGFFVGGLGFAGQEDDGSIIDYNGPPPGQPGLWCQWVPSADGKELRWDGNEKFYCYVEWLKCLMANFLKPWGYTLNGEVDWQGEEPDDKGRIVVKDNQIKTFTARTVYEED